MLFLFLKKDIETYKKKEIMKTILLFICFKALKLKPIENKTNCKGNEKQIYIVAFNSI